MKGNNIAQNSSIKAYDDANSEIHNGLQQLRQPTWLDGEKRLSTENYNICNKLIGNKQKS